jgi:endoglucanase
MTVAPGFFVPQPNPGAIAQLGDLRRAGKTADAALIQALIGTPSAVWFSGGSPTEVEQQVGAVVAQGGNAVPVLVAYNVPGRDGAQYSAGGAADGDDYRAWIAAFSAGIADHRAIVILEPDGLALQPSDFRQPDTFGRAALIGAAVDTIAAANPQAAVYLDGGHSAWHSVAEMAGRLANAGVSRASGFFLNASNYQPTADLIRYGTSISTCLRQAGRGGSFDDASVAQGVPTAGLTHFVIDTSRNGQGPWTTNARYPDKQDWCNPPDRGLGIRPTLDTGDPLVDAYLWIKIPGESDGTCTRGAAPGSADPEWDLVDPPAGQWFPQQALQLARLADPPLVP